MKLLITSYHFHPNLGGIETASAALAGAFVAAGHEVVLATATPADPQTPTRVPYEVLRRPSLWELRRRLAGADLLWQNGLSLRLARALPLRPRPWVVTHQGWLVDPRGAPDRLTRLKAASLRFATSVAISTPIAGDLPPGSPVIPNPYRDDLFRLRNRGPRRWAVGFLGRLVSDKGADLLLEALALLPPELADGRVAIIGGGPEQPALEARAADLGLAGRVDFLGAHRDAALGDLLNQVEILVVPSRWAEPFGIVALEGLACGCALVVSRLGGLPEAAGPAQAVFENDDVAGLRDRLAELLADPARRAAAAEAGLRHVAGFTAERIAARYLALFDESLERRR